MTSAAAVAYRLANVGRRVLFGSSIAAFRLSHPAIIASRNVLQRRPLWASRSGLPWSVVPVGAERSVRSRELLPRRQEAPSPPALQLPGGLGKAGLGKVPIINAGPCLKGTLRIAFPKRGRASGKDHRQALGRAGGRRTPACRDLHAMLSRRNVDWDIPRVGPRADHCADVVGSDRCRKLHW